MTLRTKTLLIITLTLVALMGVLFVAWRSLLLSRFDQIERAETRVSTLRAPGWIEEQIQQIDNSTLDWSAWDDTYQFVADNNEEYRTSNLTTDSYSNLRMDVRGIFDREGKAVSAGTYDGTDVELPFPEELRGFLDRHSLLAKAVAGERVAGLAVIPGRVVMFVIKPILTSEHQGPARGAFLYARFLDEARIARMSELSQLTVSAHPLYDAEMPGDCADAALALLRPESPRVYTRPVDEKTIAGYIIQNDAADQPALLLKAATPRLVHAQALSSVRHMAAAIGIAGLVFCLVTTVLMRAVVLRRLENLAIDLASIADGSFERVGVEGKDEIATVSLAVNSTLDALDRSKAHLAESEARFRSLADATPVLIWVTGTDRKCTYVNAGWLAFTGRAMEQEIGEGWAGNVHMDDKEACLGTYNRAFDDRLPFELVFRVLDRHGEYRWVISRGVPRYSPDGSFLGYIGCCTDITDRKRMEDATNEAREAAEAASRAKSEFLANMSHEIRTPMTAILGYADLMNDSDETDESRRQCVETIRRNGQHLLGIINDILDLSKIEAGKVQVEMIACSPGAVVAEVESLLRVRSKEKGIDLAVKLETPIPARIVSDPTRVRQILLNLVGNAIKFTPKGGVTVAVSLEREGTPALRFDVSDTGVGISGEQVAGLFQPFTQSDSSVTRKFGGTGLGLAISRRLAEMLGGSVSVTSEPGVGSTFTLRVPAGSLAGCAMIRDLRQSAETATVADSGASVRLSGRILLAEDGPDNQKLISFHLRKAGAEVDIAENGLVALRMVERSLADNRPYSLVLMDMQMPEMDGYTATKELRTRGSKVPIAALTAHAMDTERRKCIEAGCDDFATKPIDRRKLLELCARLMKAEGVRAVAA